MKFILKKKSRKLNKTLKFYVTEPLYLKVVIDGVEYNCDWNGTTGIGIGLIRFFEYDVEVITKRINCWYREFIMKQNNK